MDLTYMKALESFRNRRSPVWDRYSASQTRKGCKFSSLFSWSFSTSIWPTKLSNGPDSEPHMSITMDLTYLKTLESFRNRRIPVWDRYSASHTRKGCKLSSLYFLVFFDSFLAEKCLQRTTFLAAHVKHDGSNLYEGPWVAPKQEESRLASIFSLAHQKRVQIFKSFSLAFFDSFLAE